MKLSKISFVLALLFISSVAVRAQVSDDIAPKSSVYAAALFPTPAAVALTFDAVAASHRDLREDKLGHMPRFAHALATDISLTNAGTWTTLTNGDKVWRCRITSTGALALIPSYDAFYIPQGASLHIYTPDRDEVIGAFTSANNPASGIYSTGLIHGNECILEYYEPLAVAGQGRIHINEVGHAYRMVPGKKTGRDFNDAEACEVNVACPEGNNWQDQKNAVVRILVKTGNDYGWCSGTLMNNTSQDCTPYVLSADHCYQDENNNYTAATTADLLQWTFYFNYESPTCANPTSQGTLANHFLVGCTFKAASLDNGGDNGSDFALLKINNNIPLSYHPYYAGWNNVNVASNAGVSIHHPSADIKKISTYATTLVSNHWGNFTLNTHWEVEWAATVTSHGVTEGGSSGSPIFDANKRVVGTLTGGGSDCATPFQHDQYGKLSYHWTSNGLTSNQRLKDWLDPTNTGATAFDGQYAPCNPTLAFDAAIVAVESGPICDQNVAVTATLQNFGNQSLDQDSLTFTIDGGSPQTLYWTGALNPLESTQVSLPSQFFPQGTHTVTVTSSAPDGNTDLNTSNDSKTGTFTVYPSTGHYTFTLETSDRGANVSWQLVDADNTIVYSGGPYTNTAQTINQSWCLPAGCYTFTVFNSAGLGLKGITTDGTYEIKDNSGSTVAQLRSVTFGAQESTPNICSTAVAGVNDIASMAGISIYPNPSSGVFTVTNASDVTALTVTDALGRLIATQPMHGESTKQIDLIAHDSGIYFFHFISDKGTATRKVVLNKGK